MDIVRREKVIVPNAVLVSGITLSESDQDLESWLMRYGSIKRTLLIDSPASEFHRQAIIEFQYRSAMDTLRPLLPLRIVSTSHADVIFNVRALSSVYTHATGDDITRDYLEELQEIARVSGKPYQLVIQEELRKLNAASSLIDLSPTPSDGPVVAESQTPQLSQSQGAGVEALASPSTDQVFFPNVQQTKEPNLTKTNGADAVPMSSALSMDVLSPPSVQRVVVEHVVRTTDAVSAQYVPVRLRSFSGKIPRPPNEPDYDTWRASVDFLLDDPSISDLSRTRKILDSLLPPATDVVKHIGPQASPAVYLDLLESVYGSVEDGDELLARFMTLLQNQGEKPSSYLHRLQVMLSATVRRGGISEAERDRSLLKQFCRGCWDNRLLSNLRLEERKTSPPSFAELVVSVRAEEDKQASKEERMRSHLGMNKMSSQSVKPKATAHQLSTLVAGVGGAATAEADVSEKAMSGIHTQLAPLKFSVSKRGQADRKEAEEFSALKTEVNDLRAQIQAMESVVPKKLSYSDSNASELAELKKQVAELKAQMVTMEVQKNQMQKAKGSHGNFENSRFRQVESKESKQSLNLVGACRPRPGYCFHCGEEGHIAVHCENEPDPSKVARKRSLLREKQAQWDLQNQEKSQKGNFKPSLQ
ncbi:zinc finger CCHC domain-containing protein 12-like [Carassius auratus]|uniref:Zinc finger CCHC domain-containing protein 12-like n=1 Tax=Carassius auratus TaxID=7957 RepID=A0A6P6LVH3_CARAU|nr:zinc finger CCHC domain-containing protein 12-like [Carassius auratus]XP_026088520.1 zinc finger CCHC domain-containing protein 12-like [Carassius auratus]